jgi:cohesin complex subunit SCC1
LAARASAQVFEFDNTGLGMEDFQMDIGGEDHTTMELVRREVGRTVGAYSHLPSEHPALEEGDETYADLECPIVAFDMKGSSQVSETDNGGTNSDGKGYSKNTVRALGIIRKELEPVEGDGEERVMSFKYMSTKVRALMHTNFIYLLISVGSAGDSSRCCGILFRAPRVRYTRLRQLSQSAPFENIDVRPKAKLWERQRHGSTAPSISSSMGL